jgi:transketolase
LKKNNIESSVFSYHTIKPFDSETTQKIFRDYDFIVSLEEHSIIGGFSSAILESLVGCNGIKLENYFPFALPSVFTSKVGDQNYLRNLYGISPEKILEKILNEINK